MLNNEFLVIVVWFLRNNKTILVQEKIILKTHFIINFRGFKKYYSTATVCINITVETHLVPNGFANLFSRRTISSIKTQTNVTINDYIVLFLWYKCNYLWQDETLKLKLSTKFLKVWRKITYQTLKIPKNLIKPENFL